MVQTNISIFGMDLKVQIAFQITGFGGKLGREVVS